MSLAFGALLVPVTAGVLWFILRGRFLPTVLGAWLVWSVVIFCGAARHLAEDRRVHSVEVSSSKVPISARATPISSTT